MSFGLLRCPEELGNRLFPMGAEDKQIVGKMSDNAGLAMPIAGAIKELVKDGRRIKQTNPADWTGRTVSDGATSV